MKQTIYSLLKIVAQCATVVAAITLSGFLTAGCGPLEPVSPVTPNTTHPINANNGGGDILNIGDPLTVTFSDLPVVIPSFDERIKTDGTITLLYSQTFKAAGKLRGDLEREIRARYVPDYFNNLTVTIKPAERFYFVDGEVKLPNRFPYSGETTVLKAIASAQGFTDFAKRTKVRLTRANGQTSVVDCDAALYNPALDVPIYPGDRITVPRRLW